MAKPERFRQPQDGRHESSGSLLVATGDQGVIKFYGHENLQLSKRIHATEKPDLSKRLLIPTI